MNSILADVSYNIYFNIAAILNLIIVLFAYAIHKKLPEQKNRMFMVLAVATLCSTIVDLLSALGLSGVLHFSNSVLWGINCIYFLFVCSIPFFFFLYSIAFVDEFQNLQKFSWQLIVFGPVLLELIAISVTPAFHIVFEISETGEYIRNYGVIVLYGLMLFQIASSVFVILRYEGKLTGVEKVYFITFLSLTLIGVAIQFLYPNLLVQHFAISICLLFLFTSLQITEVITDPVTGLLNYKSFMLMMDKNFKKKQNFTIISVHIDDLQFLNSTFGMEGVNILLNQIAEFLQTLSSEFSVYQLETDLFCVVIPDVSPVKYSRITATIVDRFSQSWKNSIIEMKVTARQCVIRCPIDAANTETIIDTINSSNVDARYKNDKLIFAENIDVSTRKRYAYIEQLVKTAIQEHRIQVMYQPLFSTSEQRVVAAEALVRMTDKEGNYISPDEFVPIAEQDGFILRIGLYVYEEVCRFLATSKLKDLGLEMIDVNLSVAQCMQTRVSEEFQEILESYNLDPSLINLEITETAAAHTPELLYKNMDKFKKLGFACSLDDYGTGYANLSYMLHMPFSMIKIDKEIIWSAMKDVKAYVMLVGIIDMIHKLNMRTVAEGIETEEMVQKLTELKCDYLQGFYYSKPVPESVFFDMMKRQADELGVRDTSYDSIFPEGLYPENSSIDDEELGELEEVGELEEINPEE